ncbi:hypothetical protein Emag_001905 [Eimeria magna]
MRVLHDLRLGLRVEAWAQHCLERLPSPALQHLGISAGQMQTLESGGRLIHPSILFSKLQPLAGASYVARLAEDRMLLEGQFGLGVRRLFDDLGRASLSGERGGPLSSAGKTYHAQPLAAPPRIDSPPSGAGDGGRQASRGTAEDAAPKRILPSRSRSSAGKTDTSSSNSSSESSSSESSNSVNEGGADFAEVYSSRGSPAGSRKARGPRATEAAFAAASDSEEAGRGPPQEAAAAAARPGASSSKSRGSPRRLRDLPPLMSATDAAVAHIRELVQEYNEQLDEEQASEGGPPRPRACGIRIALQKQGCSGMAYSVSLCMEEPLTSSSERSAAAAGGRQDDRRSKQWGADEVVPVGGGLEIRVAADAVMLLVGTQVDFVDEDVQTGFVFNNPNQKQSCGCGKSFMV